MSATIVIEVLDATAAAAAVDDLAAVLADCVAGGASVSFMAPFTHADAARYFRRVADEVAAGETVLLAARLSGRIVGAVQLGLALPPNQPHRADVKKLLVHRSARKLGIGAALMRAAEDEARRCRRTLLVLDTANGAAERLYDREGWTRAGVIPGYALWPQGGECDTTIFWKRLA
jgi:GNAT superfamily N-acetyltransferase